MLNKILSTFLRSHETCFERTHYTAFFIFAKKRVSGFVSHTLTEMLSFPPSLPLDSPSVSSPPSL